MCLAVSKNNIRTTDPATCIERSSILQGAVVVSSVPDTPIPSNTKSSSSHKKKTKNKNKKKTKSVLSSYSCHSNVSSLCSSNHKGQLRSGVDKSKFDIIRPSNSEPIMAEAGSRKYKRCHKRGKSKHQSDTSINNILMNDFLSLDATNRTTTTKVTMGRTCVQWCEDSSLEQLCPTLPLAEYTEEEIIAVWGDSVERRKQEEEMDNELKKFTKMGRRMSDNASCTTVGLTPIIDEERRRHRQEVKEEAYYAVLWEPHYLKEAEKESGQVNHDKDEAIANVYHDVALRALQKSKEEANRLALQVQIFQTEVDGDHQMVKPSMVMKETKEKKIKLLKLKTTLAAVPVHGIKSSIRVVGKGGRVVLGGCQLVTKQSLNGLNIVTRQSLKSLNSISKSSLKSLNNVSKTGMNVLNPGKNAIWDKSKVVLHGCQNVTRKSMNGLSDLTGKAVIGSGRAVMKSCNEIPRRVGSIIVTPPTKAGGS